MKFTETLYLPPGGGANEEPIAHKPKAGGVMLPVVSVMTKPAEGSS